eukprot:TRINITY_DN14710_c0_g1_i2.p1 TRINITY_DN14710_c0_g1~~TRINITY_DN14710_c0_g1_i2.p1  ORF type:complete len:534 (-),score=121.75 TRINITY_DN14710_c0_g1_i2:131-1732(-)
MGRGDAEQRTGSASSAAKQRLLDAGPKPASCTISTAAVTTAVLSSFLFGYSICVLNSCAELIAVTFEWCRSDWETGCLASRISVGLVNAAIYAGAALGAKALGLQKVHLLGSRRQIIIGDGFFVLGAVICACAQGFRLLVAGRLLSGIGLGLTAIAGPMYLAEVAPREKRGTNGSLHGVLITVGILGAIAIGLPQGPPPSGPHDAPMEGLDTWYWRFLLLVPAPIAALQAILFSTVMAVDPPNYLVQQSKFSEARAMLYRIYGLPPPASQGNGGSGEAVMASSDTNDSLELQLKELMQASKEAQVAPHIRTLDAVFDPWLRPAILLGFGLAALQQLCGINALMAYSNSLFQEAGIAPAKLTWASVAMATANVCVSVASSTVVDKWGRRSLLLWGTGTQGVAMMALAWCLSHHEMLVSMMGNAETLGIVCVFCFTLFVTSLSTCGIINWLSCFTVVFGARLLTLYESVFVFGLISSVGALGIYIWVVETKGCSMDDSPMTPRSGRSASTTLNSPAPDHKSLPDDVEYHMMEEKS